jgi:hypothetical protein
MQTIEKPSPYEQSTSNGCERLQLHFYYCGLIAAMIVVFLISDRWTGQAEFTVYLSNAATMTSLLLGVVAIFYSFISNDGMSRSLGSIHSVTDEVRQVRSDIKGFAQQINTSTETATENNKLVEAASHELSLAKRSLDVTLVALASQNEALTDLAESFPGRMDQLESKVEAMGKQSPQSSDAEPQLAIADAVVESFLKRASLQHNLLILGCVLSEEKQRPLDVPALCKAIEWNAPIRSQGFLGCMSAVRLCAINRIDSKDGTYRISLVHPMLKARSKGVFTDYVADHFSNDQESREKWMKKLAALEALYA